MKLSACAFATLALSALQLANGSSETKELEKKIRALEVKIDALTRVMPERSVSGGMQRRGTLVSPGGAKRKTRAQLKAEAEEANGSGRARRLTSKSSKSSKSSSRSSLPSGGFCYQDRSAELPTLASFTLGEIFFEGADLSRALLEFGVIEVEEDHSISIEMSVTTLLLEAFGGQTAQNEIFKIALVGAGVLAYPILRDCSDVEDDCDSSDDDYAECLALACRESDTIVSGDAVKPLPFLPIDVTIIGGFNSIELRRELQDSYEIFAQLDLSTTTAKFLIPSDFLDEGIYLLDVAFVTATAGINIDLENPDYLDWQVAAAVLGPHIIEVQTVPDDHDLCARIDP